ncbi:hypothetical protein [Marinobacter sp. SS21]|uniref:hypothetical protein n=1 Tax=Marinobacter sp. SS21 TaxID=2979460 RepID=UPI0023314DB7|nr:hypothetical protein [Marinobacter sp. SS21]MDC0664353.1 hypothetical protein [Marinobacter sp. SS21]
MSDKTFQDLVDEEHEAFEDHMSGEYSSEKQRRWVEASEAATNEFWRLAGCDDEIVGGHYVDTRNDKTR